MPTNRKKRTEEEDRILALLALSSEKRTERGSCPSAEKLRAFGRGSLPPEKRREILRHLNTCPACYSKWLDLAPPPHKSLWGGLLSQWKVTMEACLSLMRNRHVLCMAISITLVLMTSATYFFWWEGLENQISRSYQAVLSEETAFEHHRFPLDKPGLSFGFAASSKPSPEGRAFGAGLWTGRQTLLKEASPMPDSLSPGWKGERDRTEGNEWSDTRYAKYFLLGKWTVLVRTLCLSGTDAPHGFWEQQIRILGKMRHDFKDVRLVSSKLGHIQSVLENSAQDMLREKHRHDIATELYALTERLF